MSASQEEPLQSLLDLWEWVGMTLAALATNKVFKFEPYGFTADLENYSSWHNLQRESSHSGNIVRPRN